MEKQIEKVKVKKTEGKFKTFTNATVIQDSKDFQPYLGKPITINIDYILSIYPSEDEIGTRIHCKDNQNTWTVVEDYEEVIDRINE